MDIIAVGITSETCAGSKLKVAAVETAVRFVGWGAQRVLSAVVEAGVAAQPVGFVATSRGAQARAALALDRVTGAAYGIGIENGLVRMTPSAYVDLAVVFLTWRVGGVLRSVTTTSTGLACPLRYVERSAATGWEKTAGEFIAEETGCEAHDWQSFLTDGLMSREALLEQAVAGVLTLRKHAARWWP